MLGADLFTAESRTGPLMYVIPDSGSARVLDNGHLLTWEGEGHTARRKSLCTEGHMYAFLFGLTIPPDGTVCRDAPIPA